MASAPPFTHLQPTIFFFFLLLLTVSVSQPRHLRAPFKPNTLFFSVYKHNSTNLHLINLHKRTPQLILPLILDLNSKFVWVNCDQNYSSTTYRAPFCHSTLCSRVADVHYCHTCTSGAARPGCHNNTCAVITTNPLTLKNSIAEIAEDAVTIQSIDRGISSNQWVPVPQFVFACAPSSLLQGISSRTPGVRGIAALSHAPVSLPVQLASHFGLKPQFSLCLSPSTTNNGGLFFGRVPPSLQPRTMSYTPLAIGQQGEYVLLVRAIKINNVTVPFNSSSTRSLVSTTITTTKPYTTLHHSVFRPFSEFFGNQMKGVRRVVAVPPFGSCYDARNLTRAGGPEIDFVFVNRNVSWKVDALVRVGENVSCLGFVDGGNNARAMITIGVNQLENNFVQFDLLRSRFGFIPSRVPSFSCSNFNFTSGKIGV